MKIESFVFAEVDVDYPAASGRGGMGAEACEGEPKLKGMVAALPLEKGAAIEPEIEKLRQHKIMRGVRRLIQNQPDPDFCIRPDFIAGLKLLAPHDISFDICVFHHHLPNVIKMVEKCPEVRFVLDHIGKPAIKAGIRDPWREAYEGTRVASERLLQDLRRRQRGGPRRLDARAAETLHRPRHRMFWLRALDVWRRLARDGARHRLSPNG